MPPYAHDSAAPVTGPTTSVTDDENVLSVPAVDDALSSEEAEGIDELVIDEQVIDEQPADELVDGEAVETAEADEAVDAVESADDESDEDAEPEGPTFRELGVPGDIADALERRGVRHAFPIQAATLPDALAGRDVLGRGRTGSGKTLAFGLPMLTRLSGRKARARRPLALILVPTRELAMQVHDALEPYGRILDLRMKVVCGGMSMPRQIMALERGVEVLVATPGRLQDLVDRGDCALDNVEIAVLDEADQMADMGFLPEVSALLDLVPAGGQRMLFSATLDNGVDTVVEKYLNEPVTHSVDPHASSVSTMTHHVMVVQPKDKVPLTAAIAARRGRTMVFVRTKFGADRVAQQLRDAGVRAEALHGGMTQGARTRTLAEYKEGRTPVLVATDVAARGIHVDGIDLVLHVDPAGDSKDYLHRAGRTARAGEAGAVVTLVLPHQRRGVDRLMEDAGVEPQRLRVQGLHDKEMRRITGARSLGEVRAQSVADAAVEAEEEAERLAARIIELKARAAELRVKAAELAEAAKSEDADEAQRAASDGPRRGDRGDRGGDRGSRGPRRDDRGGSYGDRPRRDDRGGSSYGARPYGERSDRGPRRDERGGDRSPFRGGTGERRSYGDRPAGQRGSSYGERSYGDRGASSHGGERGSSHGERSSSYGDRGNSYGDRPRRDDRGGSSYGTRPYGERSDRGPRRDERGGDRPSYGDRPRGDRGERASSYGERKPRWKN